VKVCDIVQFYSPLSGGVKRYIRDKMRFLASLPDIEHAVIIPSHRRGVQTEYRTRVYELESMRLIGSQSYRMLLSRKGIEQILEAERPDVIEVGDPYRSAWIAADYAERNGIPILSYYHSDYPRALKRTIRRFAGALGEDLFSRSVERYLKRLYNRMNVTVVATERLQRILDEMGVERTLRIPLGTDTSVFFPRDSRESVFREFGLDPDAILLMFAGRLAREKNVKELIALLDELTGEAKVHLLLVGDGEQRLKVQIQSRLRKNLTWLPYCDTAERMADLYSASDYFVHAGTSETFGLVSLEAQACGTPVLVVRGGGMDETLRGEEHPLLAESSRAADLAEALRAAIRRGNSPWDRPRRARRARELHSSRRTYSRLLAVYRGLHAGTDAATLREEVERVS
jgi:alpha-1,6-mannosyltransferase